MKVGDVAQCDGMLTSPHVLRQALHCKTVEVPRLQSALKLCETKAVVSDTALLAPGHRPAVINARAWWVGVSLLTVGVIVGLALGPRVSLP